VREARSRPAVSIVSAARREESEADNNTVCLAAFAADIELHTQRTVIPQCKQVY